MSQKCIVALALLLAVQPQLTFPADSSGIGSPPFIEKNDQPLCQTVTAGQNVPFQVLAGGSQPIHYQWQRNGTDLTDSGNVIGANAGALSLTNVSFADAGTYTVRVSNSLGALVSSPAVLTVQTFSLAGDQYVSKAEKQIVSNFAVPHVSNGTGFVATVLRNPRLFSSLPSITAGALTYQTIPNAVGTASVKVELLDRLGIRNGPPQTFNIKANIGRSPVDWFVAPSRKHNVGDGSVFNPWDLQRALTNTAVQPGDTIWLRDGTYHYWLKNGGIYDPDADTYTNATCEYMAMPSAFTCALEGAANAPITVRARANERPIIDGYLRQWAGGYVTYRDLEITLQYPSNRGATTPGPAPFNWWVREIGETTNIIDFNQSGLVIGNGLLDPICGVKIINCMVHDNLQGLGLSRTYDGKFVYGCLIYCNGWHGPDRNHGHGFYQEHQGPNQDCVADNLVFDNFAEGAQNYGSRYTFADRGTWDGNVFWMNGLMAGDHQRNFSVGTGVGSAPAEGARIINNMTYSCNGCGSDFDLGYGSGLQNSVVQNNYLGSSCQLVGKMMNVVIANNTFAGGTIGIDARAWPGNRYLQTGFPARETNAGTTVFVRANQFESGRANIVIYNWAGSDFVSVDLSPAGLANGAQFELHQANDYFNDVTSGVYCSTNSVVSICMTNHGAAAPVGQYAPQNTFPVFGVFVIRPKTF